MIFDDDISEDSHDGCPDNAYLSPRENGINNDTRGYESYSYPSYGGDVFEKKCDKKKEKGYICSTYHKNMRYTSTLKGFLDGLWKYFSTSHEHSHEYSGDLIGKIFNKSIFDSPNNSFSQGNPFLEYIRHRKEDVSKATMIEGKFIKAFQREFKIFFYFSGNFDDTTDS
jgi:hypothetical protein